MPTILLPRPSFVLERSITFILFYSFKKFPELGMLFSITLLLFILSINIEESVHGHLGSKTKEDLSLKDSSEFKLRQVRKAASQSSCSQLHENCDISESGQNTASPCCFGLECRLDEGHFSCRPKKIFVIDDSGVSSKSKSGKCPFKQGVHLMTKPIDRNDKKQFNDQLTGVIKDRDALLKAAIYFGDGTESYRRILRDMNGFMRENYKKMTKGVGDNIYPLIVASDFDPRDPVSGVGSTFTLYLADGSSKKISPTPPEYEMLKNVAHIPLGVYVIVGAYLRSPLTLAWTSSIRALQFKIYDAIREVEAGTLDLPKNLISGSLLVFKATNKHIDKWLSQGAVSVENFQAYTREIYPVIEKYMTRAATIQAEALVPALQEWKHDLGSEWENTYFIVPTVWPVSAINPRHQAILELVSPEQARTHIIMVQNQIDLVDQRATLGRIVGDRAAALLIFGTDTDSQKELVFGLTSAQDVLSIAFEKAISKNRDKFKNHEASEEEETIYVL